VAGVLYVSLNMQSLKTIKEEVQKLNLPPIVIDIIDGKVRSELTYRCSSPFYSLRDGSWLSEQFIPLWECGITITAFNPTLGIFCKLDLETPDQYSLEVENFDKLVADLFIDLWEDDVPESVLHELAIEFGFAGLAILIQSLESGSNDDYRSWRKSLLN
jgi:hypothetical protein